MSRLVVLCAFFAWLSAVTVTVTASNFNTNFLSLNQPVFARSPVESDEELYKLAATFAPKIFLQSSEKNLPSDIQYFLDNTQLLCNGQRPYNHPANLNAYNLDFNGPSDGCRLVTLQDLGCPSCTNPPFLGGYNPTQKSVPVYVFVVDKDDGVKDLIYFTFYPYNNGKNVCVGYYFDNVCPCFKIMGNCVCPRINGCAGGYSSFGNHVGDWEHVTVRLVNGVPSQVYLSEHSHGETHNWGAGSLQYEGSHPVAYAAYGSHALYGSPGRHTYQNLPNGDSLNDDTDAGIPWNTWENLVIIRYSEHYEGDKAWLNYRGDWGNDKAGCGVIEYLSGECVLNSGPSGPPTKGFLTSQQLD